MREVLGNSSVEPREINDFYATPPEATQALLNREKFSELVWEPACGKCHISNVLNRNGYTVLSSDLVDRGCNAEILDFLEHKYGKRNIDIITNPPFKYATKFLVKSLNSIYDGNKIALLLRIQFLEGIKRYDLFKKYSPKKIYVFSNRIQIAKSGDFDKYKKKTSPLCYAWFVWEKGYTGNPEINWINTKN